MAICLKNEQYLTIERIEFKSVSQEESKSCVYFPCAVGELDLIPAISIKIQENNSRSTLFYTYHV